MTEVEARALEAACAWTNQEARRFNVAEAALWVAEGRQQAAEPERDAARGKLRTTCALTATRTKEHLRETCDVRHNTTHA